MSVRQIAEITEQSDGLVGEDIRGVKSERAIHTLGKGLIEEVGRAEAIGRPILWNDQVLPGIFRACQYQGFAGAVAIRG